MKLIAYARVSTDEQAREGHSLKAQRDACRAYAHALGHHIVGEYQDAGKSGTGPRPNLDQALALIVADDADGLVANTFDRFARNTRELLQYVEHFEAAGKTLVSVRQQFDTSTPIGKLMVTMLAGLAEFEVATLRQRTKDALAAKQDRGEWVGRPPLGMRVANGRLEPDPAWTAARDEATQLRTRGLSLADTAAAMTTPKPTGEPWTKDAVRRLRVTRTE